jgi:hypothetical protein
MEQQMLKQRLLEKGWTQEEVDKTLHIITSPEKEAKHIEYKRGMNFIVYWLVLLVLTIANFMISVILVPFLLVFKPLQLEITVAVLGLVFGLLFNHLILNIEHVRARQHYAAAIFIPVIAILNIFIMVAVANGLSANLTRVGGNFTVHTNPYVVAMIYVAAFLIPYVFSLVRYALQKRRGILVNSPPPVV